MDRWSRWATVEWANHLNATRGSEEQECIQGKIAMGNVGGVVISGHA